ncbi:MAG: hypothetical protein ACRDOH_35995 [Streptosporangiaceae bacterium]
MHRINRQARIDHDLSQAARTTVRSGITAPTSIAGTQQTSAHESRNCGLKVTGC